MNIETIKTAIYSWASSVEGEGVTVIWADQNAPAPETPYTTLRFMSSVQIGHDSVTEPYLVEGEEEGDPDGFFQYYEGNREFTIDINTFGANALQRINDLRDSLERESIRSSLAANEVVFVDRISFQNLTDLNGSQYEERGFCELLFRCDAFQADESGLIEKVEITTELMELNEIIRTDLNTITIY